MTIKEYLIWTSALLLSIGSSTAQTVDIVKKGKLNRARASISLEFVTIKATGVDKDSSIPKLFFKLKKKAQELGANSFKLNKFEKRDKLQKASLSLDIYFCSDSLMKTIRANHLKKFRNPIS
jgi:hypothetical protein